MKFPVLQEGHTIGMHGVVTYSGADFEGKGRRIEVKDGREKFALIMWEKSAVPGSTVLAVQMKKIQYGFATDAKAYGKEGAFDFFADRTVFEYQRMGGGGVKNLELACHHGYMQALQIFSPAAKERAKERAKAAAAQDKGVIEKAEYKAVRDIGAGMEARIHYEKGLGESGDEKFDVSVLKNGKAASFSIFYGFEGALKNIAEFNAVLKDAERIFAGRGGVKPQEYINSVKEAAWRKWKLNNEDGVYFKNGRPWKREDFYTKEMAPSAARRPAESAQGKKEEVKKRSRVSEKERPKRKGR